MYRAPLLAEIISYLELFDLISLCQVNRELREACKSQELWRREALRHFIGPACRSDQFPSLDWKEICLQGVSLNKAWKATSGPVLSVGESEFFFEEIQRALTAPEYQLPPLRRDVNCFETIIQDLLGNPSDQFSLSSDYSSQFLQHLKSNLEYISREVEYYQEVIVFQNTHNQSFLGKFKNALLSSIEFFGYITRCMLTEIANDETFLQEYVERWTDYCNSIVYLNELFLPFTDLVFEISGGCRLNLMKVMVNTWTTCVFEPLENKATQAYIGIFSKMRTGIVESSSFSYESADLLHAYYQSVCDISLDESSIYLKNHRHFLPQNGLGRLNVNILRSSVEYYRRLKGPLEKLLQIYKSERKLLQRICLPSVQNSLYKMSEPILLSHILEGFSDYQPKSNQKVFNMDHLFAYELRNTYGDCEKIQGLMADLNEIISDNPGRKSDENIEIFAKKHGFSLDIIGSPEVIKLLI